MLFTPLALTIFSDPTHWGGEIYISFKSEHSIVSYSLNIDQLRAPVLIFILYKYLMRFERYFLMSTAISLRNLFILTLCPFSRLIVLNYPYAFSCHRFLSPLIEPHEVHLIEWNLDAARKLLITPISSMPLLYQLVCLVRPIISFCSVHS